MLEKIVQKTVKIRLILGIGKSINDFMKKQQFIREIVTRKKSSSTKIQNHLNIKTLKLFILFEAKAPYY